MSKMTIRLMPAFWRFNSNMCHTNNNIIRLELGGEVLSEPVHVWKPANQFWFGRALVEELFHFYPWLIVFSSPVKQ
jgi:hypothetical protein